VAAETTMQVVMEMAMLETQGENFGRNGLKPPDVCCRSAVSCWQQLSLSSKAATAKKWLLGVLKKMTTN